ncbi:MAG: aspartate kinase [bacterium]
MSKPAIVCKFGGSSLDSADMFRKVAEIVCRRKDEGFHVVVVVSAAGTTTDRLIKELREFSDVRNPREMDMYISSGERMSAAIMSMVLRDFGKKAISLTGSQAGIITDDNHNNARIIDVRPARIKHCLQEDNIVVVSGFQGVSFKKEVTTLGRGGSDVTAVALAQSIGAKKCEIYSDVDGVFDADPRIISSASLIGEMNYEEMQELSEAGACVLHPAAVEFAKKNGTEIFCKNTTSPEKYGTVIKNLKDRYPPGIRGIASEKNIVLVHVWDGNSIKLQTVKKVLKFCENNRIKVKQTTFHRGQGSQMVGSFIISEKEHYDLQFFLKEMDNIFKGSVDIHEGYSAVSLIGTGITAHMDYIIDAVELLSKNDISVGSFHTSSFRISLLVRCEHMKQTVSLLHDKYI